MKLRRAMAVTAATAAIAPAALLTAPAAYADGSAGTSPTVTSTDEPGAGGGGGGGGSSEEGEEGPGVPSAPADPTGNTGTPGDTGDDGAGQGGTKTGGTGDDEAGQGGTETGGTGNNGAGQGGTETGGTGNNGAGQGQSGNHEGPKPTSNDSGDEAEPTLDTSVSPAGTAPDMSTPEKSKSPEPDSSVCEDPKVDVGISDLPGKIAVGGGWHGFSLDVVNSSDSTLKNLDYFAGASVGTDGTALFKSKQIELQVWNPDRESWTLLDEEGYAVGYIGYSTELKAAYQVNIPMRLNVKASAPVGAGFAIGATVYGDSDGDHGCTDYGSMAYRFQIAGAGTDTDGTKPQEGGEAPVTDKKPVLGTTPKVAGSLATTGADSDLPMISFLSGLTLVTGTGAVYLVRRRRAGSAA